MKIEYGRPDSVGEVESLASPRPWSYYSVPSPTVGRRDWIEDANGNIVVENVGHLDGPLIVAAVNRLEGVRSRFVPDT